MKRGRPQDDEHEASHERWLVSYADFITLMFAFFAVLFATSEKDMAKSKEFQDSIKRYLIKAGAFGDSGQQINQGIKNNTVIESPIPTHPQSKSEAVETLEQAETFVENQLSSEERKKYISDLSSDDWGVRVTLPADLLFAKGSERFKEEALPFLDKLSALLAQSKRKVLIEGHVASGELGTYRSTWDSASARAVNMLRYLQKKENLPGKQLAVASFGDSRALSQTSKAVSNSRLEVVLLNQDLDL